jgi:co-chaperonin GroES (HSP10)
MAVRFSRLKSDHLLVKLDPRKEKTRGGIVIPETEAQPIRTGVILQAGPGRWTKVRRRGTGEYKTVLRPMDAQVGERVAFLIGSVDTKTGQAVTHYLQEDERVIREDDVLFAIPDGIDLEVSR